MIYLLFMRAMLDKWWLLPSTAQSVQSNNFI